MTQEVFKNEILPLLEEHREDWLEKARETAIRIAESDPSRLCTIDMVRAECPPPPEVDPRVMGAVFQCRGKNARWEKVGHWSSLRKACHGRPIAVFKLKPETVTPYERTHTLLAESVGK